MANINLILQTLKGSLCYSRFPSEECKLAVLHVGYLQVANGINRTKGLAKNATTVITGAVT